jgi:hypothetical protein
MGSLMEPLAPTMDKALTERYQSLADQIEEQHRSLQRLMESQRTIEDQQAKALVRPVLACLCVRVRACVCVCVCVPACAIPAAADLRTQSEDRKAMQDRFLLLEKKV